MINSLIKVWQILGGPYASNNKRDSNDVVWSEEGVLYLCRNGTTAALNQIYTLPINAHRQYAFDNNQVIITRKIDISSSTKLYNIYVNSVNEMGSDTFSIPPEPFSVYYRTSGIDDNTGGWTVLDNSRDFIRYIWIVYSIFIYI
jgi:hypothetical protein